MKIFIKSGNECIEHDFNIDFIDDKFQIVGEMGNSGKNLLNYAEARTVAENNDKDVLVVNSKPSEHLWIIKLVDMQKFLYEQKKAKKNQEKKQKAAQQKMKEIKFHMNIADNDLKTKVTHAEKFLNDNCKVKIVLELRGREVGMKDYAKEVWNTIMSNFSEYKIEPEKFMNNSFFTFVTK